MENQKITFGRHPSAQLNSLFSDKPFQGQVPKNARIVFLSSDANYSPQISEHDFFKYILEYQEDGVRFWEKYNVHHPFLIDEYPFNKTQNGRPFHNNFRRIGLDSSYAEFISFIELLDIPTIGSKSENRKLFYSYANIEHLKKIDQLYLEAGNRLIFISRGVLSDMIHLRQNTDIFRWLPNTLPLEKFVTAANGNKIQEIYHFSSSHINREIGSIKNMIDAWLEKSANNMQSDAADPRS